VPAGRPTWTRAAAAGLATPDEAEYDEGPWEQRMTLTAPTDRLPRRFGAAVGRELDRILSDSWLVNRLVADGLGRQGWWLRPGRVAREPVLEGVLWTLAVGQALGVS